MNIFMILLMFVFLSFPAFATNYYIYYGVGNDSNAGTSTGAPFNTCTPIEVANFLVPGDNVYIHTDVTFVNTDAHCAITSAGSAANPINIGTYGGGVDPIFDGSVAPNDPTYGVIGWTGWTLYKTGYSFTVTTANASTNAVYSNNGINYTVNNNTVSGTTLSTLGLGAPTSSGTLTKVSGTGDATITFSSVTVTSNIYVSNQAPTWSVQTIINEGTSTLRRLFTNNQNQNQLAFYKDGYYQNGANNLIYISFRDNSDPASHTLRFGKYDTQGSRGLVRTDDLIGRYINFNHIHVYGANWMGFSSSGTYVNFTDCLSEYSARENFYFIKNAVQNSTGASHNTCLRCTARWGSAMAGQNVTIESPYVDVIDSLIEWGWMAGLDWLDYNSQTDASHGRAIRTVSHGNGQRRYDNDPNGFDPPGVYIDGGSYIQLIDSVFYTEPLPAGVTAGNAVYTVALQTEHPSTKPVHDVDIINSLIYGSSFIQIQFGGGLNCSGAACRVCYNLRMVGSTVYNGSENVTFSGISDTAPTFVTLYNNVFYRSGGDSAGGAPPTDSRTKSDYNTYFNTTPEPRIWNISPFASTGYTLAQWQTLTGNDIHSQFGNPTFVGSGTINNIIQDKHLSSIAAGQGSNSPALGAALSGYLSPQYVFSSIGTVRTDSVTDNPLVPASGYHYLSIFQSSTFPSNQVGTDYY